VKEEQDKQSEQITPSCFVALIENGEFNFKCEFRNEVEELAMMTFVQMKLTEIMDKKRTQ
jgi:hypothetical protein